MQGLSLGIKTFSINDNGLKNAFTLYKFVVGLNSETNGTYSQEDTKLASIQDTKIRDDKAINLIKERISDPKQLAKLLVNKQNIMWAGFDSSVQWGFGYYNDTGVNIFGKSISYSIFSRIVQKLEKVYYIFICLFATIGIFLIGFNSKKCFAVTGLIIILLILLINFGIYSLIEIQSRYRDFQVIFIFIISAVGIDWFDKFNYNKIFRSIPNIWYLFSPKSK